jgi:hypothetical protein
MRRRWLARPYAYADGVPWNDGRYEIFIRGSAGDMVSVGGAMCNRKQGTIAFLCPKSTNRIIRTPLDAANLTDQLYVKAATLKDALTLLKKTFPDPENSLAMTR